MNTTASGPIIVTGDTGFIGAAVVRRLADRYTVIGFNRRGQRPDLPNVEAENVDVTSDEAVIDGLRAVRERHGSRITSVIHLAAYYDFSGEPSPMYERVTVRGTERLLRGLADFEVGQFVFSSTGDDCYIATAHLRDVGHSPNSQGTSVACRRLAFRLLTPGRFRRIMTATPTNSVGILRAFCSSAADPGQGQGRFRGALSTS